MKNYKDKKHKLQKPVQTILTTEKDELELRREKAKKEKMVIKPLQDSNFPFVSFSVSSPTGIPYTVEIRSLKENTNSCSCPDFQINTLGTCKHVQGVLSHLNKKRISSKNSSPFVEIFLNKSENPSISIAWPNSDLLNHDLKQSIQSLFSSNSTLLSSPLIGMSSIEYALSGFSQDVRNHVRISSHLQSWIDQLKRKELNKITKEQFLEDVKEGKRSLNFLTVPLYKYQEEGMLHLAFQGKALLADEMGLGKTIQAIAACELLRRLHHIKRVLVISPASLKGEWEEQIAKFTGLPTVIVKGLRDDRLNAYEKEAFFFLVNYEQVRSDFEEIQNMLSPDVIILDEAQRIKNWQTKTAWAVKQLKSPYAFVLTGTPIENRIDELYSLMQVVDPSILGPLFKFNQKYYQFNAGGKAIGYKGLQELNQIVKPVLLRRLKKDVEEQLPERTVNNFFVKMDPEQQLRYDEYNVMVCRLLASMKKRPLSPEELKKLQKFLACMRMIADTPYILDEECRICPKLDELKQFLPEIMEGNQNKIIIFSEWEKMLFLIRDYIENELKCEFAWHTGSVRQEKRLEDIKRFKIDPNCRFFLTTDSGSTGLNLQVANVVINFDLPWNPAKLEQRIARAWRKHQTKAVQVINLISENTIEHRILSVLSQKQALANGVLDGIGDFDVMAFPSARKEILDQLSEMFEETITTDIVKRDPIENFKNQAVSHFNDRVQLIELHENVHSAKKTVVALIDQIDSTIEPKMKEFVQNESPDVQLELLDQQTYALLQRLAEAGMITIHSDAGKALYRSENVSRKQKIEKEKQFEEAKKLLNEGERKMKMANLLESGGFYIEALSPCLEGLSLGNKASFILKKEEDEAGKVLLGNIEAGKENGDQSLVRSLLLQANKKMDQYNELLTRVFIC